MKKKDGTTKAVCRCVSSRHIRVILTRTKNGNVSANFSTTAVRLKGVKVVRKTGALIVRGRSKRVRRPCSVSTNLSCPNVKPVRTGLTGRRHTLMLTVGSSRTVHTTFRLAQLRNVVPTLRSTRTLKTLSGVEFGPASVIILAMSKHKSGSVRACLGRSNAETSLRWRVRARRGGGPVQAAVGEGRAVGAFACAAQYGAVLNSLRAPIDACLGIHSVFPRDTLVRDSSCRKDRGGHSFVKLGPMTDVKVGRNATATACPSNDVRRRPVDRRFQTSRTVSSFLGHFGMDKRCGGCYKLCNCAAFGTMHCFRRVGMGSDHSPGGSTPSVLCVLCGCLVIFGSFHGRVLLLRVLRSNRSDRLSCIRGTVRGHGCAACSFHTMNRAADALASRRRGTGVHGNVTRYVHNSIFRVILSHHFVRHCRKSSFGLCHTLHDVGPSPCLFCFSFKNFHVFNSSPRARYGVRGKHTAVSPVTKAAHHGKSGGVSTRLATGLLTSPGRGTRRMVLMSLTHGSLDHGYRSMRMRFCGRTRCCDRIVRLMDQIDNRLGPGTGPVGTFVSAFPTKALDNTPGMGTVRLVDRCRPRDHKTCNNYVKFVKLGNALGRTVAVHAFIDHGGRL